MREGIFGVNLHNQLCLFEMRENDEERQRRGKKVGNVELFFSKNRRGKISI